jgi:hypothetical protein
VRIAKSIRAVLAGACWTAAVLVGLFAVAGYVGGGAECARAQATQCGSPNAAVLFVGIPVAIALGVAGALLWRPGTGKRRPRRPWEYLD